MHSILSIFQAKIISIFVLFCRILSLGFEAQILGLHFKI